MGSGNAKDDISRRAGDGGRVRKDADVGHGQCYTGARLRNLELLRLSHSPFRPFSHSLIQSCRIARLMFRHVPNLLTGLRLLLAMVFFCMLAYYQYEGRGDPSFLWIAFIIYLVALIT